MLPAKRSTELAGDSIIQSYKYSFNIVNFETRFF
jgi:hypothetical protein